MKLSSSHGRFGLVKQVLMHLLFWVLIISYFAWGFGFGANYKTSFSNALFYLPGHMLMVYSLIYFLIPRYLITKKYWLFFCGFLFVLLICMFYAWFAQLTIEANDAWKGLNMTTGRSILPFVHVAGIAGSINLLKYWYWQKQQTIEAVQQKTAAELQLLKSQIHPHFLFNTLNNLYSHILDQSPRAAEITLKLSSLLRFMIYESSVALIPLTKEISLLQEYIALEQIRYGNRLDISVAISGNIENRQIPPLLILPLVENAFKHGVSNQLEQCWISFDLHVHDDMLFFKLINSKDAAPKTDNTGKGGIGLQNVKKRLELLYPGRHQFVAGDNKDVFIVSLELDLATSLKEMNTQNIVNRSTHQQYGLEMFTG